MGFHGVGSLRLGMTTTPGQDAVVALDTVGDPTYQTAERIHVGSSLAQLQNTYRGHVIETELNHPFGQGSSGVRGRVLSQCTHDRFRR